MFGWQREHHAKIVRVDDFELLLSQTFKILLL